MAHQSNYNTLITPIDFVINSGEVYSSSNNIFSTVICGVYVPNSATGSVFYIEASFDGIEYRRIKNSSDGTDYAITLSSPNKEGYYPIDPSVLWGVNHLRFESAVAQASTISLSGILKPL